MTRTRLVACTAALALAAPAAAAALDGTPQSPSDLQYGNPITQAAPPTPPPSTEPPPTQPPPTQPPPTQPPPTEPPPAQEPAGLQQQKIAQKPAEAQGQAPTASVAPEQGQLPFTGLDLTLGLLGGLLLTGIGLALWRFGSRHSS